jgi:thymidylate synthase ThyX
MLGLRTSKAAHPQIRALMQPVLAELEKELPFF